jgi:methylenetetrahydrofolate dehydrogenase (NADP+)/methenyltetrahydrofolate cyclohydrolase
MGETMGTVILDGRESAARIKKKLANYIISLQKEYKIIPGLAVIRVGNHQASQVYVASKLRQCQEVGIQSFQATFDEKTSQEEILEQIHRFNADSRVHGILVQMPLPLHLNSEKIINAIDPLKDVDGLHPQNLGSLMTGVPRIIPCTPRGCLSLMTQYQKNLKGLYAVILGRSILVGKPLALLLLKENCTVVIAHSKTRNLPEICRQADILVAAVGSPRLVKKEWVKPGAIVLDVGINHLVNKDGSSDLCGDVDFEEVKEIASAITPVPGGIGPMTVAALLQNTVELMVHQLNLS